MKRAMQKKIAIISSILDSLYPDPQASLHYTNPYTLLIATLLSGQSSDRNVNRVTPLLFASASTAQEMLLLPISTIQTIIRPCGLSNRKAHYILALSKKIVEEHQGQCPTSMEELQQLPGVGRKTAAVVRSEAFKQPEFPIDTHLFRSARRWNLTRATTTLAVEKELKKLFEKKEWYKRHLQIIYYGREWCPARKHRADCLICQKLFPKQYRGSKQSV